MGLARPQQYHQLDFHPHHPRHYPPTLHTAPIEKQETLANPCLRVYIPRITWLCIALGGALGSLGSLGRHGLAVGLARFETFPFGTLAANVLGSLVIGIAAGFWEIDQRKSPSALFLITGFCGGFTTFSTFSLQTLDLIQKNDWTKAGANIAVSVAICLLCTWAGWLLGQSLRKTAS